jgi:hypothetical protein
MGGREMDTLGVGPVTSLPAALQRAAAVRIADQVAAEHPHPLDDLMPRLAGRLLAKDPAVAAGVRELLDAVFGTRLHREPQEGP